MARREMEDAPPCQDGRVAFFGVTLEAASSDMPTAAIDAAVHFDRDLVERPRKVVRHLAKGNRYVIRVIGDSM